jgi:hypothetical protein
MFHHAIRLPVHFMFRLVISITYSRIDDVVTPRTGGA